MKSAVDTRCKDRSQCFLRFNWTVTDNQSNQTTGDNFQVNSLLEKSSMTFLTFFFSTQFFTSFCLANLVDPKLFIASIQQFSNTHFEITVQSKAVALFVYLYFEDPIYGQFSDNGFFLSGVRVISFDSEAPITVQTLQDALKLRSIFDTSSSYKRGNH